MYNRNLAITKKIEVANYSITNAINNPIITTALTALGYDITKLNEGKSLLDNLKVLQAGKKQQYIEQRAATADRDTIRMQINEIYRQHLKLARMTFKNEPNMLSALEADSRRLRSFNGWKAQVTTFYDAALNNQPIMDGLARFNITATDLVNVQTLLTTLEDAEATQKTQVGEAQQATLDRDKAIKALDDWMSDFQGVARLALKDNPQLLEALGIAVKR